MKILNALIASIALIITVSPAMRAETIDENNDPWYLIDSDIYIGQGFLTPATSNYLLDGFAFYNTSLTKVGGGTLYLLDYAYTGAASGLPSVCICSATWNDSTSTYDFTGVDDSLRTLTTGNTYYAYAGQANSFGAAGSISTMINVAGLYGKGESYASDHTYETSCVVTGTAIPEPATEAAFAGMSALALAAFARKNRAIRG
jgi:hypothetical protein